MDKETLKMFSELLDSKLGDLENRLDSKLGDLENGLDSKLGDLENRLDSKLGDLENRLDSKLGDLENRLDGKLGNMEEKLNKNTMLLENLTSKVEIIAKVQKSHMDENEKAHNDIIASLTERMDVMDLAIKDSSKDVVEIKERLINVELITSSNWNQITKLKMAK